MFLDIAKVETIKNIKTLEKYYYIADKWIEEANWNNFNLKINPEKGKKDLVRLLNNNSCLLGLIVKDIPCGFMGITTFTSSFSEDKIANEHYWYVLKDYRKYSLLLLYEAEKWVKANKYTHFIVNASYLASGLTDNVIRIYEKLKFNKFEASFIKYLGE